MAGAIAPLVTVAIPSFNQGEYLEEALVSIFEQGVPVEVMLADGGSTDGTLAVIERWRHKLSWWRSGPDGGQAAAINEALAKGSAPYVCWLNSDDYFLPGGLAALLGALQRTPHSPVAYGNCWIVGARRAPLFRYRTNDFSSRNLARRCFIAQPATLIRRAAWEQCTGLDTRLDMALDYDLWWRLFRGWGRFTRVAVDVAASRTHFGAKTISRPRDHYREAKQVVREHFGTLPWVWYCKEPLSVGWRLMASHLNRRSQR